MTGRGAADRHASPRTRASSGSPKVVRSPARSTSSARSPTARNESASRSRCSSDAWRSPAAAILSTGGTDRCLPAPRAPESPLAGGTRGGKVRATSARRRSSRMGYTPSESLPDLVETMKKAAAAIDAAGVPVLLGGGLAAWARGGPPTDHDVDFFVREAHAEAGLAALEDAGMRPERPPEGWLLKAWDGDTLVDLIFRPSGGGVDDEMFARATDLEVMAHTLPVASIDDVLATKVLALNEQEPDFHAVLEIARSLREQVDWDQLRVRVDDSAFGAAFITLVERL